MTDQLDILAFRFFKLFAQYESKLKMRGYFREGRNKTIIVDWDRFADKVIAPNFLKAIAEDVAAARFILENPPMKQVINDQRRVVWKKVPNDDQSAQALVRHICRIRNNLFHGAKFNDTWFDPARSKDLLDNGLRVLEHYKYWLVDPDY